MNPNRFIPGQSSAMRKSRLEGKPSMLPKPRRPGSTDRLSTEARRPSTTGHRSSSAEPPRATFGGGRLSREASATKLPPPGRSRSQQSYMTPLRSSQYSARATTTPVRTPSEDRASRSWQMSLDRALAYVTVKDQRNITNVAWQRQEIARVQEALAAREAGAPGPGPGGAMALIRPLTIARFVDIVGGLLNTLTRDAKLNNDNYVTKLPHLSKRLLYPGTVSKSWLKTVNTLHAFPHALALIAYLLDLVNHIEMPVCDEWLYVNKDELSCLRRDYLYKCWIRFQDPGHEYEDLNEEYLQNLKVLLGNDDEKIFELQQVIKKYELCLEDEGEQAARADEARRSMRRDTLQHALRAERAARRDTTAEIERLRALRNDQLEGMRTLDQEIERASAENRQLKESVERQEMSVEQRTRLLDEVDYSLRVQDSKRALLHQITKMVQTKEAELALWQKNTLDSCREYKQGLIHLSAEFPDLASLAIDEKELMRAECSSRVSEGLAALRRRAAALLERRAAAARERSRRAREHLHDLEETRAKISELKITLEREKQAHECENSKESAEAAAWSQELQELNTRLEQLQADQPQYETVEAELRHWQEQDRAWRAKLSEMQEYIREKKEEVPRLLEEATARRTQLVMEKIRSWNEAIEKNKNTIS